MSDLAIISVEKELDPIKENNLMLSIVFSNFIWMVFHFTVVFFFTFQLKSVALVGIFLGIGNLFSFLLDISIGIIQKYFKPKTLFIMSFISQITAMLIFAYFIFQVGGFIANNSPESMGFLSIIIKFFLEQGMNLILLLVASFCYGLTKELQEVTYFSYILNNSSHNQISSLLAKKNLFGGIGAFVGLLISGLILKLPPIFILILTIFIIIFIIYFTKAFFDNSEKTITLQDIYKFKVHLKKEDNTTKASEAKTVNKLELKNIVSQTKYLFLKPITIKSGLTFKLLYNETRKEFIGTYNILADKTNPLVLYWCLVMVMTFGFWDTFAATFLIGFLDTLWNGGGYVLLGIIAIPAFGLQDMFSKISIKYGVYAIGNIGIFLSGTSLFLMGVFAGSENILLLMGLALINSVGYAACMSLSQAGFLESYNEAFAKYNKLSEIDANASAAPLKIVGNFANVIGLFFGGIILALFNYMGFFILFGGFVLFLLFWTIKNKINKKEK
ncbi:hypothetical protein EOM39_07025 [Candidatus Gracilibacteria bacterium]|nr:hypothetical protein [Candidatus Gracilibacteria bacterium]